MTPSLRPVARSLPSAALAVLLAAGCNGDDVLATSATASSSSSSSSGSTSDTTTTTTSGTTTTTTASGSDSDTATGTTTTTTGETTSPVTTTDGTTTTTTTGETTTTTGDTTTTTTTGDTTTTTTTGDTTTTDGSSTTDDTTTTGDMTTTTGGDLFDAGYVGMSLTDSVVAFDLMTENVLADVSVLPGGDYPYDVTIRPDGSEVWIVGAVGDGVVVIDTATNTVTQTIDLTGVGEYAVDVAFNTAGDVAYVSSRDSEALVVIDADAYTVSDTIALPGVVDGGKMTVDPCSDLVYMVNWYDKDVLRIDVGAKTIDSASIGKSLWDLRITADGETLYVIDRGTDDVLIVDAATLTVSDTVAVGDDPWGIELAENDSQIVVACEDDSTIHIIDAGNLSTIVKTLPMGASPRDVDVLGAHAYVPSGDVLGNDGIYKLLLDGDEAVFIDLGMNYNANAIAVKPQPVKCVP